jgi:uncharacterized membrane protein
MMPIPPAESWDVHVKIKERTCFDMGNFLLQIGVAVVLGVIGLISMYVGIKDLHNVNRREKRSVWQENSYLLIGISAILLALLLFIDAVRSSIVQSNNSAIGIILITLEVLFVLCTAVSCFFMIRSLRLIRRKNTRV